MMDPEVWWFDVRFARLPFGVAFHVPTITLQHSSMVASQCSDLMSGVMYIRKATCSHSLGRFRLDEYTAMP